MLFLITKLEFCFFTRQCTCYQFQASCVGLDVCVAEGMCGTLTQASASLITRVPVTMVVVLMKKAMS